MPRRSFRARVNEANNGSKSDPKTSQQKGAASGKEALETFYNPNEMKRQIADALKEPKSKAKREKNRPSNNSNTSEGKRPKKVLVESEQQEVKKMVYADAVRNSLGNKEKATTHQPVESKCRKVQLTDEEKSICDNICSDNNSNNNLTSSSLSKAAVCDLLKDAEIIEELEDSTWEVISSGECSQDGEGTDDHFHLVASDEIMTMSSISGNEADKENRTIGNAVNNNIEPTPKREPKTEPTFKKKILVSRKYIGGPDLPEKLIKLGFQEVEGKNMHQPKEDEDDKRPAEHWSGSYKGTMFEVEAKRRCGLLVTSVKAKSESLLIGLNCLQGLIDDTGLLSYANFNVPTLMQDKAKMSA